MNEIQLIAARIPGQIEHLQTEEATKHALMMRFITALGYDVFDPTEVVPEYTADFGMKKGARVDYAIMKDGNPIILFECKSADVPLDDMQVAQLAGYFAATDARFAVLTNGVVYRFYSDLDKSNKMDLKPFLEINMLELDHELCQELSRFTKASFDVSENVKSAVELKYTKEIMRILSEQVSAPTEDFVKFFASQIYSGNMTQAAKQSFTQRTKEALNQFINNRVNDRLKSAMANEGQLTPEIVLPTPDSAPEEIINRQEKGGNTTTPLELEGFNIVKSILRNTVAPSRIAMRDVRSYCGILLDDVNRKPICRLRFDGTKKWLGLMDEQKKEEKVAITELDDIYRYADRLRDTVARYELVAKHDEEPDLSLGTAVSYKTLKLTPRQMVKVNQSVNQ